MAAAEDQVRHAQAEGESQAQEGAGGAAPTSADVARRAGVSRATVSYVLNSTPDSRISPETRARVLAAAAELGYTPHALASSLRAGHSNLVLVPLSAMPSSPQLTRFYEELAAALQPLGYTMIQHVDRQLVGLEAARAWATLRPAGLLVELARLSPEAVALLRRAGTRAILALADEPVPFVPTLLIDSSSTGTAAAEHLLARGHRRLAAVVPREQGLVGLGEARLAGVARAAQAHGVPVERLDLAFDEAEAARLVRRWRDHGRWPGGICAYNDEYALLLMRALLDAGFAIPDELAVVGVDDLPVCTLVRPRLSSVRLALTTSAIAIAATLDAMIHGRPAEIPTLKFAPSVVARESS